MRTIIHIGQHKTGTTSIQHYLQSHRQYLAEAGLYVPDILLGYNNPSHFLLNVYALDDKRESTAKTMLKNREKDEFFIDFPERLSADIARHYQQAKAKNCREIIWSNEGLYLLNSAEEYRKLKSLFDTLSSETLCVCAFRDRDSFRQSYIKQQQGLELPASENPDSYRYLDEKSWLFDYDRKKELLSEVFENTLFLDYNPQDMIRTFLESLGYAAEPDTASLRLNATDEQDS